MAQSLGHSLVAEYEASCDERRVQLVISELARIIKFNQEASADASHANEHGAEGEGRPVLLSKHAVRDDVRTMLPFVVLACRRYFGIKDLAQVLPAIDKDMALLQALLNNVSSSLMPNSRTFFASTSIGFSLPSTSLMAVLWCC